MSHPSLALDERLLQDEVAQSPPRCGGKVLASLALLILAGLAVRLSPQPLAFRSGEQEEPAPEQQAITMPGQQQKLPQLFGGTLMQPGTLRRRSSLQWVRMQR